MTNREAAYKKISELVERFEVQHESYKNSDYNETQTRRDFIDPFFKALGWDIDNAEGYAESYREVIHEDKVRIGKATKAPDYSFKLSGGKRLFFVEAKKPSVVVKDDILPAYQVRRYGWSAKLAVSIVTDFEEFAVYDCSKKPFPTDKAAVARIKYLTFREYLKEFDFVWKTFSKEQVLKGSFDKFVQGAANKKGTTTVDKDFLQLLDSWRTYLATSISWNNKNLDEDEINFIVQQTIDRFIFLRIAEDRGIEPYGNLQNATKQGNYYQNLFSIFVEADDKYNSGLFDFKKDKISRELRVDNKVLKTIISELYYPSPYAFDAMPVEILGTAYEQFLGKVIRITPAHHAKIEEKPEVRKAGGVYYTPEYIVEYIVKNTVGKLIAGKTPAEVSQIKIVDPACGSGSFLLGAFQYLLDWHKNYYHILSPRSSNRGAGGKVGSRGLKTDVLTPDGNLTTAEKKRILLNNIYGVDIDVNAVEVTKLSLLLKCMEGETEASINNQLKMFQERVLPTLDNNIKDGNSLIDKDFYKNQLDFGFEKKIKPFNWQNAFPEVFNRKTTKHEKPEKNLKILAQKARQHAIKTLEYVSELEEKLSTVNEPAIGFYSNAGFDVVIGNPPYGASFTANETAYLLKKYTFQNYQLDSYFLFIEKALGILQKNGLLGFIIPNTWLLNLKTSKIRKHLFSNTEIKSIVHYQNPVFSQAVVDTEIMIFRNIRPNIFHEIEIEIYDKQNQKSEKRIKQQKWIEANGSPVNIYDNEINYSIKNKIAALPILDSLCKITQGAKPFQVGKGKPPQTRKIVDEKPFVAAIKVDNLFRPLLRGSLMNRYQINWDNNYFIKFGDWLAEPRYSASYDAPEKIIIRQTGDHLTATLDVKQFIVRDNLYTILPKLSEIDLSYILGLLNSKFLSWYYQNFLNPEKGEALAQVKRGHLALLPIKEINSKNNSEVKLHDEIVKLVSLLLKFNEEMQQAKLESKREQIKGRIDFCEDRINEIVYQLYELTPEEIEIVEGI